VKTLTVARVVVFLALLVFLLFAMPWSYLPLLVANVDTQAILSRTEIRKVMAPLIVVGCAAVAYIGLDAYLGIALWRRERRAQAGARPPSGAAEK